MSANAPGTSVPPRSPVGLSFLGALGEPEPAPLGSEWEQANAHRLRLLALALVAVGLVWRFTRYLLAFPVWGDEAMLLVNYFTRDFADLFGPIDNCQIAPLLYHVAVLGSLRLFGTGELVVRLPSFLACLGSVLLFWRLARLTLPPLARTMAVGIFAVSIWPATMGSLTKPYAFDLFASLGLLVAALSWLRQPQRLASLVCLTAFVPLAIAASYPAVFVAGGIGLVLLPVVYYQRRRVVWSLFIAFGLCLVGTFVTHYLFVARPHLASPNGSDGNPVSTAVGMTVYWQNGFPPLAPLRFLSWFLFAHTGQMAAYPLGSANGGSAMTVLLGLIGAAALWRGGHRRFVVLLAAVFGLGFVAALLHKYPYGASCRLAQHVAPFYCLCAALGAATLIHRSVRRRWGLTLAAAGLLAAIGIGGAVRDVLRPYRDLEAQWARTLVSDLAMRSSGEPILVLQPSSSINPIFQWQLGCLGDQVIWGNQLDWNTAARSSSSFWVASCGAPQGEADWILGQLTSRDSAWYCDHCETSSLPPEHRHDQTQYFQVYRFVRQEGRPSVVAGQASRK